MSKKDPSPEDVQRHLDAYATKLEQFAKAKGLKSYEGSVKNKDGNYSSITEKD